MCIETSFAGRRGDAFRKRQTKYVEWMMLSILEPARSTDLLRASIVRVTCFSNGSVNQDVIFLAVTVIRPCTGEVVDPVSACGCRLPVEAAQLQSWVRQAEEPVERIVLVRQSVVPPSR